MVHTLRRFGFARNVIEIIGNSDHQSGELKQSIASFEANMKMLFRRLNEIRREAERELIGERVSHKINRLKKSFLQDHPAIAKREDAHVLFEDMVLSLDDGPESDSVRLAIMRLRRSYEIDDDMTESIQNYEKFKEGLELIRYAGRIATQEFANAEDEGSGSAPSLDESRPQALEKAAGG